MMLFNNNYLIFCMPIGSFLLSIRVQMDEVLIYAIFQQFNVQLSDCQLFNQWDFIDFLKWRIKKHEQLFDNVYVILDKIHLALFTASLQCLFSSFIPGIIYISPFWGLVIVRNKLTSVLLCICPLIEDKFCHNIVKSLLQNHSPGARGSTVTLTML